MSEQSPSDKAIPASLEAILMMRNFLPGACVSKLLLCLMLRFDFIDGSTSDPCLHVLSVYRNKI